MSIQKRGLFGVLAALVFAIAVLFLPSLIPGYDPVRQTVSEIGEVGSPARLPFTFSLLTVAACLLVFASALTRLGRDVGRSTLPGHLAGAAALSAAGVGVFAYPHPLHNVFGLSELIGYQAPLLLAWSWRGTPAAKVIVRFSAVMAIIVWATILVNLIPLFRPVELWPLIRPVFGLVQRSLFASWFMWAAGAGLIMQKSGRRGV